MFCAFQILGSIGKARKAPEVNPWQEVQTYLQRIQLSMRLLLLDLKWATCHGANQANKRQQNKWNGISYSRNSPLGNDSLSTTPRSQKSKDRFSVIIRVLLLQISREKAERKRSPFSVQLCTFVYSYLFYCLSCKIKAFWWSLEIVPHFK